MYGREEHKNALRRIELVANTLGDARKLLQGIRDDLVMDAPGETEDARQNLRDVGVILRDLCARLDKVPALLPTPIAEYDYGLGRRRDG